MPQTIKYSDIDADNRLRPVDPDHCAFLAASIEEKGGGVAGEGLQTPITVRPYGERYRLVEGGHRHGAIGLLGWSELEVGKNVIVVELDEFDALLREIDENLVRRELNPLDRAIFLAERKRVYEEKNKVDRRGGDRKSDRIKDAANSASCGLGFAPRFSVDVAERVGLSEDTIHRALRIADALNTLGPEAIGALRGTRLERNQSELLALCDVDVAKRGAIVQAIAKGEAKSVAEGRVVIGLDRAATPDLQTRVLAQAMWAWSQATPVSRKAILEFQNAVLKKKDA